MNFKQLAEKHSATAFLNSLLKEWAVATRSSAPACLGIGDSLRIELPEGRALWLPLDKFSLLGRHRYRLPFYAEELGALRPIGFTDLRTMIAGPLGSFFQVRAAEDFEARVRLSQEVIESTLNQGHASIDRLYEAAGNFLSAEQGLSLGHSFHPTPKSREGFSDDDLRTYSPEFGGAFRLPWYLVKAAALTEEKGASLAGIDWLVDSFRAEVGEAEAARVMKEGWRPLPAHPWQKNKVAALPAITELRAQGLLIDHPGGIEPWHATSSLRTIYRAGAPFMLKFSLSVRLTNSVRHVTPAELRRGLQVHEVLQSEPAAALREEFPEFRLLSEPAFASLKVSGAPLIESIVVARENPFGADASAVVVATMAQDAPLGGASLAQAQAKSAGSISLWFEKFLSVAIEPLLVAEGELGVILGAHQQNLLLEAWRGMPVKAYFRDCHGTGYTAKGVARFLPHVPLLAEDNGNLVPARMGHALFGYYLILNTVFNVVASLAENEGEEAALIIQLRSFLERVRRRPRMDPAFLNYLLDSPRLLHKGNFLCAWRSENENTTADPLAIYVEIPNPLTVSQS